MPTLLISLGNSPAIVPEAFLLPDVAFDTVHVLTTEKPTTDMVEAFFAKHAPNVTLSITRVKDFTDFTCEEDHFRFEEVMFRWVLHNQVRPEDRYICLSGGFKTMSAAMQKAAAVLGAAEVFHVLADNCCLNHEGKPCPPTSDEEILRARKDAHLHFIRLGPESGWPQFRAFGANAFPLTIEKAAGPECWVSSADDAFRRQLRETVQNSHNIAGAWTEIGSLPFTILATWPESHLTWLKQPVDVAADAEWILCLPKVELHCHLGGFATHGEHLRQVRESAEGPALLPTSSEPILPTDWPAPASPISLLDYMRLGDANGTNLLKDRGCLQRQCELLYAHFMEQNILYAEVRCSPGNYACHGRSPWQVLKEIKEVFDTCMVTTPGCHINLILIATRKDKGDYRAAISRHLALAVSAAEHWTDDLECRVVGVDLAGYEDITTRAHYFREEFTGIHRCGLALTIHAGENDDAEGIWRAVFDLNARRLGHALHLVDSPELLRSVADRSIGVEMCPYANYQIKGYAPMPGKGEYPLQRYLDAGIRVTVNTDNIGISFASLTENLCLVARMNPRLSRMDLLRLQAHALEAAFISPSFRVALNTQFETRLSAP